MFPFPSTVKIGSEIFTVADPEFPGQLGWDWGSANLLFRSFLPENCMKLKKNWTDINSRCHCSPMVICTDVGLYAISEYIEIDLVLM